MKEPDLRLMRLTRHREGAFNRFEALRAGFTARMIETRCRSGEWKQLDTHVFVHAAFPRTWTQRCTAATLSHPAAALSHQSGPTFRGLDGFGPGRVHITVPPVAHHQSALADVHRSRHHQFEIVRGVRVTTFAQNMIQLADRASDSTLRDVLHSGLHQRHERAEALRVRIGQLSDRRMPGMSRLVDLLDDLDGEAPSASQLERMLFDIAAGVPGMPSIHRQVSMPWQSNRDTIVDTFVPDWSLVLEADGRRWHARVEDFEVDRWRDNEATARGLSVMRFTWHRMKHDAAGVRSQLDRFGRTVTGRAA